MVNIEYVEPNWRFGHWFGSSLGPLTCCSFCHCSSNCAKGTKPWRRFWGNELLQLLNSRFTSRTVRKTDSLQSSQRRADTMLLSAWGVFYIPRLTATMLHFRAMLTTQQLFSVSSHPVFVIILAINTLTVHWHTSHSSTVCLWRSEG